MSANTLIRLNQLKKSYDLPTSQGTYYIQTWGCQMNEEDSEQMGLYLRGIGFEPTDDILTAQVILLNTCSVREKPEKKAYSLLGDLTHIKRQRPDVIIGVCGCMAQLRADEIKKKARHVDFIIGTAQISKIPVLVEEIMQDRGFKTSLDLPERKGAVVTDLPDRKVDRKYQLKSFVSIQYGCDKFCTYCIVPITRGRERSRPTIEIIDEVRRLAENGTKEITLLGQTVNSYGKNLAEGRVPFSKLLWMVANVEGIERIRYTSPYPRDYKEDVILAHRDCEKVMEHVHMPLQSGSDEILKKMKRVYTRESFMEIVTNLRREVPGLAITTDIIVGFPGETEEDFAQTLDMVEKVRFDGAYMFIYSSRPGTPSEEFDQLSEEVKGERLRRLIEKQNAITVEINETYIGKELEVLVEGVSPKDSSKLQGYSREYKMVHFEGPEELIGRKVMVKAESAHLWGLHGELLT